MAAAMAMAMAISNATATAAATGVRRAPRWRAWASGLACLAILTPVVMLPAHEAVAAPAAAITEAAPLTRLAAPRADAVSTGTANVHVTDADADLATRIAQGRAIYADGVLPSGLPLTGVRAGGVVVRGREAACTLCHRASGMGGAEGVVRAPPLQAERLFAPGQRPAGRAPRVAGGLQREAPMWQTRPAHTPDSLHTLLTEGRYPSAWPGGDRPVDALMPRYALDDAAQRALLAYLATLRAPSTPGVDTRTVHLATVFAGDVSPAQRAALLQVLQPALTRDAGAADRPAAPRRAWQLHVWNLSGAPDSWPAQLQAHAARQPVFALVSGLGPDAWSPVQRFCEQTATPCVLPDTASVDSRLATDWSLHFTRGTALEAALALDDLRERGFAPTGRLLQWTDGSEAAALGARALRERLPAAPAAEPLERTEPVSPASIDTPAALRGLQAQLDALHAGDALMLWLPAATLRALSQALRVPAGVAIVLSGERAGFDALPPAAVAEALAPGWRAATRRVTLHERAERRTGRQILNRAPWLRGEPVTDVATIRLQGNAQAAAQMTARALQQMGDDVQRRWFVEQLESADEAATSTSFPRFTLGPGQRSGSRGGLVLGWQDAVAAPAAGASSNPIAATPAGWRPVGDWAVPDDAAPDARP